MQTTEYRDMYYAISKGIDIGVSAESILEELISDRKQNKVSEEEYESLITFFRTCDKSCGSYLVARLCKEVKSDKN